MAQSELHRARPQPARLAVATLLIPVAALFAYYAALYSNLDGDFIGALGSTIGVAILLSATLVVSRVAHEVEWTERAGTSVGLASAYFLLTWVRYGDPTLSPDDHPHAVWFGLCLVAFMPSVVLIPLSKWAWSAYRSRLPVG